MSLIWRLCLLGCLMAFPAILSPSLALAQTAPPLAPCDPGCPPDVCQRLQAAAQQDFQNRLNAINGIYESGKSGPFSNAVCLNFEMSIFDSLTSAMDLGNMLKGMFTGLVNQLAQQVCQAAVDARDNLASKICIPIPDLFGANLSLPGIPNGSCNGYQPIKFTSGAYAPSITWPQGEKTPMLSYPAIPPSNLRVTDPISGEPLPMGGGR